LGFLFDIFLNFAIFTAERFRPKSGNKMNRQPMKTPLLSSFLSALVLSAGLFVVTFPVAGQSILININQVNPSAVQFVATVTGPLVNDASQLNLFGVDLISYFTSSVVGGSAASGTLTPAGTTVAYNQWFPDNLLNGPNNLDLNLYVTTNPQLQSFTISSPAFTGTAIVNLSSLLADLPATGTTGDIYSGYSRSPGTLIGTWVVVPEPSLEAQLALGAMVLAGLAFVRRLRRVSASR
jgi:hypothetical protein